MLPIIDRIRKYMASLLLKRSLSNRSGMQLLAEDIVRWESPTPEPEDLFFRNAEFRTLFYYRMGGGGTVIAILKILFPPLSTLYIHTPGIGPGFFIQHGFSSIVAAQRIGKNFWVNQQVTIGYSNAKESPTIGDDVTINAGALVIGGITIGDRVRIGAGAVVVKSVPADCTVVGNPAYIVKRNGIKVREQL